MAGPDRFLFRQVRARPLACFAAAFLTGALAARRLSLPVAASAAALIAAAALGVALRKKRRLVALCLLAAGLAAGFCRMTLALDAIVPVETQYSVEMVGRVVSDPMPNPDTGRLISVFQLESVDGEPSDLRVRLYLRDEAPVEAGAAVYGQRLRLKGHLWAADPVTNPYEFDFGDYLHRHGLSAYATAKLEDVTALDARADLQSRLIDARHAVARRIDALFPRNAGLMRALVLGDRSQLDDDFRQSLNRTGTAHLICISGLHVTVLAALLALLLRLFLPRAWADILAVALLVPYGAMIGFPAPFVRALVMFALVCFAPAAGHPSDSVTRLAVALLGYLLANPMSLGDAGFALSYSASAGILLLMPPLMDLTGLSSLQRHRQRAVGLKRVLLAVAYYFPSLLCASLAAQLATLPAVVAFFGVQSLLALPFNLVCVPLCMLGYVLGLVALILSPLALPLASALARVPDGLFALLIAVTGLSHRLPAFALRFGRYPTWLAYVHWAVALATSNLSRVRIQARRALPFALLLVAGVSALITLARAWPFSVTFLDAGQADSAIVRTRGHTYLFDAGDDYTPADDTLNATCLHLDGVFLSHPHQDHAAGLANVLEIFRPETVYVPAGWFDAEGVSQDVVAAIDQARDMGVPIVEVKAGDALDLPGGAQVEVFAPAPGSAPEEINDLSMLALLTCENRKVLFTGDLSESAEPEVIPDADVLKVAHHGSAKATSARFLAASTPRIAVISVGENRFGHPDEGTVEKLEAVGAEVLLTRQLGAITLRPKGDGWHIDPYLEASYDVE